jgi:hypothetical protein
MAIFEALHRHGTVREDEPTVAALFGMAGKLG